MLDKNERKNLKKNRDDTKEHKNKRTEMDD